MPPAIASSEVASALLLLDDQPGARPRKTPEPRTNTRVRYSDSFRVMGRAKGFEVELHGFKPAAPEVMRVTAALAA